MIDDMSLINKLRRMKIRKKLIKNAQVSADLKFSNHSDVLNDGDKSNIIIKANCHLGGTVISLCGGKIFISDHTYIGNRTKIGAKESVKIDECVIISDDVVIMDNNNHPTDPDMRMKMSQSGSFSGELWGWGDADSSPIHIEKNVWIGRNSTILKGVTIGEGSIVGACAVVTKDVPKYSVVAGNPAKVVKYLKSPEGGK